MKDYNELPDEELVCMVRNGDTGAEEFLYAKYKQVVRAKARSYFLIGADREDLIQEGMIGLYKAVCEFDPERNVNFSAFANICVTRQIITAIKTASRKKHTPLNSYVSFSQPISEDGEEQTLLNLLENTRIGDPEQELISRESCEQIKRDLERFLTPLEKRTLGLYLQGLSYQQISQKLNRSSKCVDNAIQRIKKKMAPYLNGE